jgi:hypothetical protein
VSARRAKSASGQLACFPSSLTAVMFVGPCVWEFRESQRDTENVFVKQRKDKWGNMDSDYAVRRALELGLERLVDRQPSDVQAALKNAKAMAARLPNDLHWTEEPAHTFSRAPRRTVRT